MSRQESYPFKANYFVLPETGAILGWHLDPGMTMESVKFQVNWNWFDENYWGLRVAENTRNNAVELRGVAWVLV